MHFHRPLAAFPVLFGLLAPAQVPVARDTIPVIHNNHVLRMPWALGINSANVSNADINLDGRQDLVLFDKQDQFGHGIFRCFIHSGQPGEQKFRADPGLSYFFPRAYGWALMRDYDNDGKADIFTTVTGGIKVYRNITVPNGVPQFTLAYDLLHSNYYPQATPPSESNLYAGSAGPAGIADVDGDGDLDILTFTPLGIYLELHRNMSQELFGHSDSLKFLREDVCWGGLTESNCTVDFEACATRLSAPSGEKHAGACIACLDSDGDQDMDLIMGDVSCDFVNYIHNTGTTPLAADFTDTTRLYPNYPLKNDGTTHIRMSFFPCAYPVDADADGKTDLVATPNVAGAENATSVWLYRNTSSTSTVNFHRQQKDFLQSEMIEAGQNSFPLLVDVDSDGRKDLVVGTRGYFANGKHTSRLMLYRNTGSLSAPVFSLVSNDFGSLANATLNSAVPAAGDIDGDGDTDICVGTLNGQVHWLENTAGAGQPMAFAPVKINPFQFTTPSAAAAPQIFDLDGDGKQDLVIGMKNGRIAWYRNIGGSPVPTFSLANNFLGKVDVKADPVDYGLDAYAAPYFFKEGGSTRLMVGTVTGHIRLYDVPSATADFQLVTTAVNALREGSQATVCFDDINGDAKRDLFIGNAGGGLSFFSSASPFVGWIENERGVPVLTGFPNPATDRLLLSARGVLADLQVQDLSGRLVMQHAGNHSATCDLDVSALPPGVYIVRARVANGAVTVVEVIKFVKAP